MKASVKVAFASCSDGLVPEFLERIEAIRPELPLWVVSEFPPDRGRWIPYHPGRKFADNAALCRASLKGRRIELAALVLEPNVPAGGMRRLCLLLAAWRTLFFNENLDHFMLRPRSAGVIGRHYAWRLKNWLRWQANPGGRVYTWAWRLAHPASLKRPLIYRGARVAGRIAARRKRVGLPERPGPELKRGITVVVPSRNGRELLEQLLPGLIAQHPSEVIVVDNGSDDDTAGWLAAAFPQVRIIMESGPLSFARAANRGLEGAQYSHVLFLNNDMVVGRDFLINLWAAFDRIPDLFCATAQIFFPEGRRREETGKAVMPSRRERGAFPIVCAEPLDGENHSYVLYGSGGCSLVDTRKALTLGGFDEAYEPAYVEDLDLGYRAWQAGWPTVFVRDAFVEHRHRATTSRYYTGQQLERAMEVNYLKFLARAIASPSLFRRLWLEAVDRLNLQAISGRAAAIEALAEAATRAPFWVERLPVPQLSEEYILALGSGDAAIWQGTRMRGRPVVLIISPYMPFPLSHGGAVRMYNLMSRAVPDYDQVLLSFTDELHQPPDELLEICCEIVQVRRHGSHLRRDTERPDMVEEFDSATFHAVLLQMMRKWRPEIAQLEFTHMAQYAPHCRPAKTILVEHDITVDLCRQLLTLEDDWELKRQLVRWDSYERAAWQEVDCVVTMSEKDRAMVQDAPAVSVIQNGVDLERFRPADREPEQARLLFIGSFAHLPNLLAVDFFLREIWPRLQDIKPVLHIIAGARSALHLARQRDRVRAGFDQPGIELEDFVADVRPAYARAAVVIAPLIASAGTNIKIMEAMAMGKAIVSTPSGVNGLDLEPDRDVIVAGRPEQFASAIVGLTRFPERRRELEKQARKIAEVKYNWDRIAAEQRRLYERLRVYGR